jgi:hypothetical protein
MYYLVTAAHYAEHESELVELPAWTLDKSMCIIHMHGEYVCDDFIMSWNNQHEVNAFRFDPNTEEWRNWETEEEHFGIL